MLFLISQCRQKLFETWNAQQISSEFLHYFSLQKKQRNVLSRRLRDVIYVFVISA